MPIVQGLFDPYGHLPVPILHLLLPKRALIRLRLSGSLQRRLFGGMAVRGVGVRFSSEQVNAPTPRIPPIVRVDAPTLWTFTLASQATD